MKSVAVACSMAVATASTPNYEALWGSFKSTYGKDYNANGNDEAKRYQIFKENVDTILAHNANNADYKFGINAFSDLTTAEFASARLGWKQPATDDLYGDLPFLGNHTYQGEVLPDSVDHVKDGLVTEIKNQGHCGSCWIFSAVGALEGAYAKARGKSNLVALAEQQVLDCDHSVLPPTMGCNGGSMGPVFNYAKKNAMCTMASYPYEAKAGTCQASSCTEGVAKGVYTGWKGLAPIGKVIPASYSSMMSAVAQQPVSVAIEADKDVFHHYSSGVVDGDCGQLPDHGVLVVGYGHDNGLNKDYWKIKNSWGPTWGEEGYVRIIRGKPSLGRGECAILNSPSYPIASAQVIV